MDQSLEVQCHEAVIKAVVKALYERYLRVQGRHFAPFRVLRLRLIERKIRIAMYGK